MKSIRKILSLSLILMLLTLFSRQHISFAQTTDETLNVTVNFKADEAVFTTTAIEFLLNRSLKPSDKLAVTIQETDVSNLFAQTENRFVYNSKLLPLPLGNSNLTVFTVEPNGNWNELAKFPIVVKEVQTEEEEKRRRGEKEKKETKSETNKSEPTALAGGLNAENSSVSEKKESEEIKTETSTESKTNETTNTETPAETEKKRVFNFLPTFTISMKSQPFQSNFPIESRPAERVTFNDFTLTGSIKNEVKLGKFSSESNFDFAGSSFKPETLQFGTLGRKAPDVDLSSYLANFQIGTAKFSLGHTSFGNNRHLVSSFSSRGLSVNIPINKRFDVTAGILNGTSVLGFNNFLGVGKIRHQVQGATFGIEFFPKRQNAMRLEISGFNGYLQALNGVSEGRVVDAEQSRGFGLRFLTSDKTERFKLEFGYALSRFFNPQDTTLDPDGNAVVLPATMRSAHYAEASYQIFKDLKLSETKNLNLSFAFKYEFVEPLYRSLGASAGADKFTHDYSLDGAIGEITFQAGHARSNDNLRNVPSILKSLTRSNRFSVAFPITALLKKSEKTSPFLPRIGYSFDRTRNFGAGIPVGGGFEIDPTTIPDLVNTNQTFSSAWQFKKFTAEYTYNRSFADNRQTEQQNADQLGWVHGVSFGVNPLEILSFNIGMNFDSQRNFEQNTVNQNKALTFGANWQPFKGATFAGNFSNSLASDKARTNRNRNINYDMQFAYNFNIEKSKFRKFGMQAFVRFADTFARNRDFLSDLNLRTQTRIMTAGMTFNFF